MFYWLTDPELFLYAKGTGPDDVLLRRCKKMVSSSSSSSSLVVPMKPGDFEYVETVKNYMELIGYFFHWDETDYKRLVKYIYEKRLLVNGQGFVIAELPHKADKDGNKTIDDANEEDVPAAIYIRSLDVLPLKPYIPNLLERPIPWRTVKYLGDVNGKAALMEEKEDSNVTKLTARVDDLESKNKTLTDDLESKNKTLTDLESKNKTLEGKVRKLIDLESKNKTLEGKLTKLNADLEEMKNINSNTKETWMNDLVESNWFGVERLNVGGPYDFTIIGPQGTFTTDDNTTNVGARYWFMIKLVGYNFEYKAVCLEDLIPNKERARFSSSHKISWLSYKLNGKTYVMRIL